MRNSEEKNDALHQLTNLQREIEKSFKAIGYKMDQESVEEVSFPEYTDPRDFEFMRNRITMTIYALDEIKADIKYLNQAVKRNGYLSKQSNGRYLLNDTELTSGMLVEIMDDDFEWRLTRIEHSGDYYAVALGKTIAIDGRKCRLRFRVDQ
ncbi:DUF5348 domain-containing protein [Exiguobacterium antarcticum]|uniref:DUF5348 domain-containing protein n=1 Tax=Exiguobacterium antarcticum TaxID=132920 RepID=A0ABT6R6Q2_9BACL|nr:DUF5348 domain-containing protein [Exiguobacterium antarcticum]MDI3236457.1 DUF5348 domain-containing protein [Exiguobacterium antarcticum]